MVQSKGTTKALVNSWCPVKTLLNLRSKWSAKSILVWFFWLFVGTRIRYTPLSHLSSFSSFYYIYQFIFNLNSYHLNILLNFELIIKRNSLYSLVRVCLHTKLELLFSRFNSRHCIINHLIYVLYHCDLIGAIIMMDLSGDSICMKLTIFTSGNESASSICVGRLAFSGLHRQIKMFLLHRSKISF